jgi:phosphatidylinositol 4-kinase
MARNIRQRALEKIAALSAPSSTTSFDQSDLDRLCKATSVYGRGKEAVNGAARSTASSLGQVPMVCSIIILDLKPISYAFADHS